jgi:hypothetical protein
VTSPKLVLGITQDGIITNHKEPSYEDEDYSLKKHNPKMPKIVPIKKSYYEWMKRPSLNLGCW